MALFGAPWKALFSNYTLSKNKYFFYLKVFEQTLMFYEIINRPGVAGAVL